MFFLKKSCLLFIGPQCFCKVSSAWNFESNGIKHLNIWNILLIFSLCTYGTLGYWVQYRANGDRFSLVPLLSWKYLFSEIAAKLPHSKLWWINGFKDWWTCYVSQFIRSEKPFDQQCLIWKSLTVAASWKTQPLCGLYYTWPRVVLLIKKAMDVMETFF